MVFREFSNPEEADYDINSSLNGDNYSPNSQSIDETNKYYLQLYELIGILDYEENELIENYGITMQEYLNPTAETIQKVSEKLNSKSNGRSR